MSKHKNVEDLSRTGVQEDFASRDPLMDFYSAEVLEDLVNSGLSDVASPPGSIYFRRSGYEHLKTAQFDLEKANLTDKQLTAISLVFYGGAKKKRAARAMNITSQALSDHLKAGLKKIQMSLG